MAKNFETVEMKVRLLNDKRRDQLGDKLHTYLRGMREYIDNRVILNIDAPKTIQVFFDSDINKSAIDDVYNIMIDFIS